MKRAISPFLSVYKWYLGRLSTEDDAALQNILSRLHLLLSAPGFASCTVDLTVIDCGFAFVVHG